MSAAYAQTGDKPLDILARMQNTVQTLNYEGDFVYQYGDVLNAMHIEHIWRDGYEREHLQTLTGASREIVRDNYTTASFDPAREARVSARRQQPSTLVSFDPQRLEGVYTFKYLGQDRVAGYETTVIAVLPEDDMRYGHRLYLDMKTALPLRRVVLNRQGKPISQLMFTAITIAENGKLKDMLEKSSGLAESSNTQLLDYQGEWEFSDLPAGFVLEIYDQNKNDAGGISEHFVFSDGIARLSLYIEDKNGDNQPAKSNVGPVGILGAIVDNKRITVVGEAPTDTLKYFINSVKRRDTQ